MNFPDCFTNLPPYAFPRLRALLKGHLPNGDPLDMSLGEPKHPYPDFINDALLENIAGFNRYPENAGTSELRGSISRWFKKRYDVALDHEKQIIALNGTREGLFNAQLALCPNQKNGHKSKVLMPNPFYQVYAVGAIAAGADPMYIAAKRENNFMPDYISLTPDILNQTVAIFLCSPSNPQGAIASYDYWVDLINLAEKYDIRIFADECYSEIYKDKAPVGALKVAQDINADPNRVVVFHSLSKRSNLPGLRSGFAASGAENISAMKQLRNYAGAPVSTPLQAVSAKVWADETHVLKNRTLYREKYHIADQIFGDVRGYFSPAGGFFLWLRVGNSQTAALKCWQETGVKVLPGDYLSRDVSGENPGARYIRVAMVAPISETKRGLIAIKKTLFSGDNNGL